MTQERTNSEADRLRDLAAERDDDDPTGVLADAVADRIEQQAEAEEDERAEQLAQSALTVTDARRVEQSGMSAGVYLAKTYGVDVFEYETEGALLEAVRDQHGSGEQHGALSTDTGTDTTTGGAGGGSDPDAEQLAESVLNVSDLQRMERADLSAREYLAEYKGVDPAEYRTEDGLRRAIARAQSPDGEAARGGAR